MKNVLIEAVRDAGRLGIWIGVSLLTLFGMVGCMKQGPDEVEVPTAERKIENITVDAIRYDVPGTWLYEVRLKDGTRCIYVTHDGGVDCDWRTAPTEVEKRP